MPLVSFALSILKILDGQPDGRASLDTVKQYLAIFYTSGSDWTSRMKRLAERAPGLDIFGQNLVERANGEWVITEKGKSFLAALESMSRELDLVRPAQGVEQQAQPDVPPVMLTPPRRRSSRYRRRRRDKQATLTRSA
ncbi:hypothetical protein ACRQ5Q_27510 [Bradyrhizobium sp. PMVTL-01]|uniref:hypothetical protein n=1 Tax=Bradyrhizobium sp. PMVTL-01 TaxID=3434999 RepID=UPI003F70D911